MKGLLGQGVGADLERADAAIAYLPSDVVPGSPV